MATFRRNFEGVLDPTFLRMFEEAYTFQLLPASRWWHFRGFFYLVWDGLSGKRWRLAIKRVEFWREVVKLNREFVRLLRSLDTVSLTPDEHAMLVVESHCPSVELTEPRPKRSFEEFLRDTDKLLAEQRARKR